MGFVHLTISFRLEKHADDLFVHNFGHHHFIAGGIQYRNAVSHRAPPPGLAGGHDLEGDRIGR